MRLSRAYTSMDLFTTGLFGPAVSSRSSRGVARGFLGLSPAGGCTLIDDWVALKQQVKEANDIVDVVGGYLPLKPAGPTFKGLCPFHDDKTPSFDVDPRRQRYRCWACSKYGDVIGFVQEFEHVSFPEALELLARRVGISLEKVKKTQHGPSRASMLEAMRWASQQFQEVLLDSPNAEVARIYLGERKLSGEMVRRFQLGFAPTGNWLVAKAKQAKISTEVLETVGLIGRGDEGRGAYYDRFRDRVIFPIRDMRGQVVGFGGRVLPGSPLAARGPKYYNSSETPLFSKSNQLYGIDLAREAAIKAGYLAVVEGYTDVIMAHQFGITNVVSTMGTALNASHVKKLRGVVSRVHLIFDADAGGDTGVDRAMEVFVSQDLDLRVGTLPQGLDPCDMLIKDGPNAFRQVMESAVDVFEFKLNQLWNREAHQGLDGQRRAVEEMLAVLATSPDTSGVKLNLMVNRIAHRMELKEETLWARLRDIRSRRNETDRGPVRARATNEASPVQGSAPAAPHERELVEILLADTTLVARASTEVASVEFQHPGLRKVVDVLYRLHAEGKTPDLDHLREYLDNERLFERLLIMQDRGLAHPDRLHAYENVLARLREIQRLQGNKQLGKNAAVDDHAQGRAFLAQLKK